ncbi:MAG: LamG-like jellyroll fold domain-containing protein [Planctomycetota bacterium]
MEDSSGNGNDGEVKGGAQWVKGRRGGAIFLNGKDGRVATANKTAFDITGNITVAAWIRIARFDRDWQAIVSKGDGAWRLQMDARTRTIEWACTGLSHAKHGQITGNTAVDDGQWHHVAGVYDGTKTYLYVDGKVDALRDTSGSIKTSNNRVFIGRNTGRGGRHFHGIIDDVRVYGRALPASEIRWLAVDVESGLVAHWKLDGKGGTRAVDSAPRGKSHGTLKGNPARDSAGGKSGGALTFDGTDDCVLVWSYPRPDTAMAYAAWVWADSRPTWGSIVKNWGEKKSGQMHFGLYEKDGDLEAHFRQTDDGEVQLREGAAKPFPLGSWQHVAVVADGKTARLYRNAVEVSRAPYDGTLKTNTRALGIGVKPSDSGTAPDKENPGHWDGKIDDVRVYRRALSMEELHFLFDGRPPPPGSSPKAATKTAKPGVGKAPGGADGPEDPDEAPADTGAPRPNLVKNGGFEEKGPRGFASQWTKGQWGARGAGSSVRLDKSNPRTGEGALVVRGLAEGAKPGAAPPLRLDPGTYEMRYWGCVDVGKTATVGARFGGEDLAGHQAIDRWTQFTETVTVEKKNVSLELGLWTSTLNVRVWFDDVELKRK